MVRVDTGIDQIVGRIILSIRQVFYEIRVFKMNFEQLQCAFAFLVECFIMYFEYHMFAFLF